MLYVGLIVRLLLNPSHGQGRREKAPENMSHEGQVLSKPQSADY